MQTKDWLEKCVIQSLLNSKLNPNILDFRLYKENVINLNVGPNTIRMQTIEKEMKGMSE